MLWWNEDAQGWLAFSNQKKKKKLNQVLREFRREKNTLDGMASWKLYFWDCSWGNFQERNEVRGKWASQVEKIVSRQANRAHIWKTGNFLVLLNECQYKGIVERKAQTVGWASSRERDTFISEQLFDFWCESGSTSQTSYLKPNIFSREVVHSPVVCVIGNHLLLYMHHY